MKNSVICRVMYKDATPTCRTCILCDVVVMQQKQAGYKNLISHLASTHDGYVEVAEKCAKDDCAPTADMFVHRDAKDTLGWIKLVAVKNFPFAHVDDSVVRSAVRYTPTTSKTLLKRMQALVEIVDEDIRAQLAGKKFALVFDGFTDAAEHSLGIFVATSDGLRFLAFSPFVDEGSMTAAEHIEFLDMVLDHYGLDGSNMVAIVADNMETNKTIARRIDVPLVGCAAHRFNLAVKAQIEPSMPVIRKIAALMRKLKTVKRLAKLKLHGCKYKPVPLHELRWSGCYRMLKRFEDIQPFLSHFKDDCVPDRDVSDDIPINDLRRQAFVDLIPTMAEQGVISELIEDMTTFDVIMGRLQHERLTVATVRDIFDVVIDEFECMRQYLEPDANIVAFPAFESGLVKLQSGPEKALTVSERTSLRRLLRPEDQTPLQEAAAATSAASTKRKRASENLQEAIAKKARKRTKQASSFLDASWIPPTSVIVERFFSQVKLALGYLRKSMKPETLEVVMFLKMNWDLVTLYGVSRAVVEAKRLEEEEDCAA